MGKDLSKLVLALGALISSSSQLEASVHLSESATIQEKINRIANYFDNSSLTNYGLFLLGIGAAYLYLIGDRSDRKKGYSKQI